MGGIPSQGIPRFNLDSMLTYRPRNVEWEVIQSTKLDHISQIVGAEAREYDRLGNVIKKKVSKAEDGDTIIIDNPRDVSIIQFFGQIHNRWRNVDELGSNTGTM